MSNFAGRFSQLLPNIITASYKHHYARSACSIRLKFGVLRSVEAYAADDVNRQAYSAADVCRKPRPRGARPALHCVV